MFGFSPLGSEPICAPSSTSSEPISITAVIAWTESDTWDIQAFTPSQGDGTTTNRRRVRVGKKDYFVTSAELKKIIEQEIKAHNTKKQEVLGEVPTTKVVTQAVKEKIAPVIEKMTIENVLPVIAELKQTLQKVKDKQAVAVVKQIEKELKQQQQDELEQEQQDQDDEDEYILALFLSM